MPPSFCIEKFPLKSKPYAKDFSKLTRRQLTNISYPKTLLTSREFGIQDPRNYHDIVYYLHKEWDLVLDHLFDKNLKIFSYSLPIPVTKSKEKELSALRAGRMIYEWIEMAEKDLVLDSTLYQFIGKTDIANFYSSIYTHSIGWAFHGREVAFKDDKNELLGNKIDRLTQYSNDARTNGISIGSALSDLIAEIILTSIDVKISKQLKDIDFIAARFKDDYRILCSSEDDAKIVLKAISNELSEYNLRLNENKTSILPLPDGLYRKHDREYFPHSLRKETEISFKTFEHTLLIALDIHRSNPGTSILEKFISELFDSKKRLKVQLSTIPRKKEIEIKKIISLFLLVKRESEKITCHILSVFEYLYLVNKKEFPELKAYLKNLISSEIKIASEKGSVFEVVWYIFFSRYIGLGITDFSSLVTNSLVTNNDFYKSILESKQRIYENSGITLFKKPKDCKSESLVKYLDVFKS